MESNTACKLLGYGCKHYSEAEPKGAEKAYVDPAHGEPSDLFPYFAVAALPRAPLGVNRRSSLVALRVNSEFRGLNPFAQPLYSLLEEREALIWSGVRREANKTLRAYGRASLYRSNAAMDGSRFP
jgi:hypothetical protein